MDEKKVFISYSRDDFDIVRSLVERLTKDVGNVFWMDLEGIESGSQFDEVIIQAIDNAQITLLMYSERVVKSEWVKREARYTVDNDKRLVPVIIRGEKLKGWVNFRYGDLDTININDDKQYNKLVKNLIKWLGVQKKEEPRQKNKEDKPKDSSTKKKNKPHNDSSKNGSTLESTLTFKYFEKEIKMVRIGDSSLYFGSLSGKNELFIKRLSDTIEPNHNGIDGLAGMLSAGALAAALSFVVPIAPIAIASSVGLGYLGSKLFSSKSEIDQCINYLRATYSLNFKRLPKNLKLQDNLDQDIIMLDWNDRLI